MVEKVLCKGCTKNQVIPGSYCDFCKTRQNRNRMLRKIKAMLHYGNSCYCCKEDRLLFLTIDHINGGGNEHREEIGSNIYPWLIKNGYPSGFQVACHNCNSGAGINGGMCPHG